MKKAYFKKALLMIMSLALIISTMALPASAEGASVTDEGWRFIDIAYGNGVYTAMAKNADYSSAKMYYSNDGGLTWQTSENQPLGSGTALISGNKPSQQQLIWWDAHDMFVAHGAGKTYTSSDGVSWTENANLHWTTNTMYTTVDDNLIFGGQAALNVTNDISQRDFGTTKCTMNITNNYYVQVIGAKPADENGNIQVFGAAFNGAVDATLATQGKFGYTGEQNRYATIGDKAPYDMVYAKGADQFLYVDGTQSLYAATNKDTIPKFVVKEGVNVTAIGASDSYIAVGMSDGTIYYTANAPITAETQWSQIPVTMGAGTAEAVTNIEFSDDTNFVALAETEVLKGSVNGCYNINDYVEIGDIEVSGQNVFNGVRLIGGTYSPTLNKYLVYGDTTTPDGDNKYWGKIFVSEDGLNWRDVYTGYTFTKRNVNTETGAVSYSEVRNGAVWWGSQRIFIVSASTQEHTGVTLVSPDGESWKAIQYKGNTDAEGNPAPELDTDMQLNTDIAVSGDKLYTTNGRRQFRTYTAWNSDSMIWFGVTNVPNNWSMNQIAVSDDEDPAVLMAQNANGAVRNNESTAENELDKWKQISAIGGAGFLTDAVFSKALNKFVAVLNGGLRTSIVSKDGLVVQGPVVSGKVCKAIDTNGEAFMFACEDGNVYTAPDTADFASAKLTPVPAAAAVETANTMPLTNVIKAGDKFIATATDNVNSDVLLVSKNSAGTYEYVKVSENVKAAELVPGETITVSVDGVNKTDADYEFTLITAIYSDGVLVQVQSDELAVTAGMSGKASADVAIGADVPENAEMKIFMWDSMKGMVPLRAAYTPFE